MLATTDTVMSASFNVGFAGGRVAFGDVGISTKIFRPSWR